VTHSSMLGISRVSAGSDDRRRRTRLMEAKKVNVEGEDPHAYRGNIPYPSNLGITVWKAQPWTL